MHTQRDNIQAFIKMIADKSSNVKEPMNIDGSLPNHERSEIPRRASNTTAQDDT
jgi:hypothetical protein